MQRRKRIIIKLELKPWQADALTRWKIPDEMCGPSVAERAAFVIDDACIHLHEAQRTERLYEAFGMEAPHGPDNDF